MSCSPYTAATRPPSPLASPLPASPLPSGKHKVAIVGSGSWGTALAKIAAENVASRPEEFEPEVRMWVREKQVSKDSMSGLVVAVRLTKGSLQVHGRNLTDVINTTHKNERYLPDIKLPKNLVAVANLKKVVEGASLIVFVVPHQL